MYIMVTYAKYHYFGDRSRSRTNVIIFATIKVNDKIRFAFSCSHNTDLYNKRLGKLKAFCKLNSEKQSYFLDTSNSKHSYGFINVMLAQFVLDNPKKFPKWATNVIKNHKFKTSEILNVNLD